ncbi:MAG: T9SS type A sorting domain-containing protein [Fidelibacterota bacterium]
MKKLFIIRVFLVVSFLLILLNSHAFASVVVRNGSYGEIFPAENGNMHILIRSDNSSYMYYSSGRVVKNVPLGVSDSSILFETAFSDGAGGVYVLYNNTANKTLYAQRYSSGGETLWDAPGSVVDTYADSIAFSMSELTPDSDFIVVYDKYTPPIMLPWGNYYGCLRAISPDGIVSSPAGDDEFYHSLDMEMHRDQSALYIRKWPASYITQIFDDIDEPADTLNSNILEFDCDDHGFLFGIRRIEGTCDTLELHRFDDQLHALWETPIVFDIGLAKTSSDPVYPRPEIIANNDGSVTLYPSIYLSNIDFARIDSLGEYFYRDLDFGDVFAAFSSSDGANLFLVNTTLSDGETKVVRLVKVSVSGDIVFSSILRYGHIGWKSSIIENTDGSYATTMVYGDTVAIDKVSSSGDVLVAVEENTIPVQFTLQQNYPNPLNPTTTISYELPEAQNIILQIFDITGRLVETLYSGYKEAGHWDVTWNASDQSSGIYIYRLTYGQRQISRKMVLMK